MRKTRVTSIGLTFLAIVLSLSGGVYSATQQQRAASPPESQPVFAGQYVELQDQQKPLVDDWFRRFSETIHKTVGAAEGYDNLPLSVRTTFNAVTHALLRTRLTDSSGKALAESAIEIINKVDNVAGKVPGAGGDRQFRIYVQLKPGALDLLDKSQEFKRRADNTVYHKGYPTCYRSTGGTPSIQVSATRDGSRADIDVDYRSSSFPIFLINGHLSSSNSDVRAGNNDVRHNQHWSGLRNWWRNLLGIPLLETNRSEEAEEEVMRREPKVTANAKLEAAVYEFLNTWLVEQKPSDVVAYFSDRSFACLEIERGEKIDYGMARFVLLRAMQDINREIGKVAGLSDAVLGVRLTGPRVRVIEQPHHAQFVLYDVREDLATQFDCTSKLNPGEASAKALRSQSFGKYYGAVFRIKTAKETGETVATLWAKEGGYWKLISFDVEPQFEKNRVPDLAASLATPAVQTVNGDPDLIRAGRDFLEKWFIHGRIDEALAYVSPRSYSCVRLYKPDDAPAPQSPEEAGAMIRQGMEKMGKAVGTVRRLEEATVAPAVTAPDIRMVEHPENKAYVIASIPDYMAEGADCSKREPGTDLAFQEPKEKVYGNYYAIGFRLAASPEDAGVLWTVWHKEANAWKIVSYAVLTP